MDENYIDLADLFKALKKRWVLIVICTLVVSLCTMGFTYFLIKPEYQSTVKMFIGKDDVLDTKNQGYSNSDVSMYQSLLKTYGEIIRTKDLVKRAINNSGYNISAGQVISNLSVETLTNTQVIKVTYTGKSPEECVDLLKEVESEFIKLSKELVPNGSVEVLEEPRFPLASSSPNVRLNLLLGVFGGLIIGSVLAITLEMMKNTFSSKEELENLYSIPVIGVIPDQKIKEKVRKEA